MPRPPARPLHSINFSDQDVARFWAKVATGDSSECWPWTASKYPGGYGNFRLFGSNWPAHRVAYVLNHGTVHVEAVIDHLCRNRACVNPSHLEAVSHRTNIQRGIPRASKITHCTRGHEYDEANTGWYEHPHTGERERFCRSCKREKKAEWRADPENQAKSLAYAKEYSQRPEAKQRARESAARKRAKRTPEQQQAYLEYMRSYYRRKKAEEAAPSAG